MLDLLKAATPLEAGLFFLVANAGIFVGSIALCWLLGRHFHGRRIFDRWEPLRPLEIAAALGLVVLNAVVSCGTSRTPGNQLRILHAVLGQTLPDSGSRV
jgi:Delta7-sterol 5-desaturase